MKDHNKPQRNAAHRKEDKSKREFEELIDPFFVPGWNVKDYGIDSVVEITTTIDALGNADLESKCFLVQLKSVEKTTKSKNGIAFSLPVKKIIYWYNYNLPVLFVLYDIQDKLFYYEWVDETLIATLDSQNHDWSAQKTITIKIPAQNKLEKQSTLFLKEYVLKWKMPSRRKLEPGKYFQLKGQGYSYVEQYKLLTHPFDFHSVNETIKNLETSLELSLYRIALTGPSRVGKSSLINGLLKKDVSPTGFFQTTGVPIQIIPGTDDEVTLYFNNGPDLHLPFSLNSIKQYASQDHNEDNKKGIRLISISVKNQQLERGVSLFDIPGLDDPSDEILDYTWQTIKKVNAVIYVIDASPAQDGGYIFRNDYKKHIITFSQSQDKVFLVFNKADKLSEDTLVKLKEKVSLDLSKHGLSEIIGEKVFFLSAEKNKTCQGSDSIDHLNEKLWEFILKENKSGIVKLSLINQELFNSTKSLIGILSARLLDHEKRGQLQIAIDAIKRKTPVLESDIRERQTVSRQLLMNSLDNKSNSILSDLEIKLKKVALDNNLPRSTEIKKHLLENLNHTIEQSNNEYLVQINQLKNYIDQWIEENLKQLREILKHNSEAKTIDFTEVESFESPQIDYSSAWGMGFIGMAAAYFFAPAYIFAAGIIGFFGNLFTSAESRRVKQISKIMDTSRDRYHAAFSKIKNGYNEIFNDHLIFLNQYINQKLHYYFQDLEEQLSKLKQPDNPEQIKLYKEAFGKIEALQAKLTEFDAELRSFHFSR